MTPRTFVSRFLLDLGSVFRVLNDFAIFITIKCNRAGCFSPGSGHNFNQMGQSAVAELGAAHYIFKYIYI